MEEKNNLLLNKQKSSGCWALGLMLIYIIPFFFIMLFPSFIRGNIYARLAISRMELGPIIGSIFSIFSILFGAFVLFSYAFIVLEIFSSDTQEITKDKIKPFQQRQKKSKPWLIGILVGLVPLLFGLIYAIRHKDWKIIVYPIWIIFSVTFFVIPPAIEISSYGIYLKLSAGLIAYLIVRKNKLSIKIQDNKSI
tara:strand:+ start:98 stop:679 length:582 start_codon:yes stop_codon:yes gene_type:complete